LQTGAAFCFANCTPQSLQTGAAFCFANCVLLCPQENQMLTFSIPAISCGHCARAITDTILELDPAAKVQVDVAARTATVDTSADPAAVRERLAAEGYPVTNG
jgi:copper chaperone